MKKFIILWLVMSSLSVFSFGQDWKKYPYTPEGSVVTFPADEGRHPAEPIEWWYTVGHVVGKTTGTNYSYMLTYFYTELQPGYQGFRILNFSNDDTGEFFADTQPLRYTVLSEDSLNIQAATGIFLNGSESWITKVDEDGRALPFQYEMEASSANGALNLDYDALKPPLILGGDGKFDQGVENYTYYYSQTQNQVEGSLMFKGLTEEVEGTAWIDRQYGTFNPYGGEVYEWFCLQLSNGMDINVWSLFTKENTLPENERYKHISVYVDENTHYTTTDFTMDRLAYEFTEDGEMCYSQKWRLRSPENSIDVTFEVLHAGSEVILPFRFYEGATRSEGTVNGLDVTGRGFAELLHSYEHPALDLMPEEDAILNASNPITWDLTNPDDGRVVYYDLFYSVDNKENFLPIVAGIQDTFYVWSDLALAHETECWIQVEAYSIDTTLYAAIVSDKAYTVENIATTEARLEINPVQVNVYPNPANGTLNLRTSGALIRGYEMFDISGKRVMANDLIPSSSVQLDVGELSQGVYLIKCDSDQGMHRSRFVIRR